MPRTNPQVESLQWEVAALRKQIERMQEDPGDIPFTACDNSCVCATARGMATNGGCRCDEKKLRRAIQWWRRRAEFLQMIIQEMRNRPTTKDCPHRYDCEDICLYCGAAAGQVLGKEKK